VQARSVATRSALLDAAIEALLADGYAKVTTTEIARRAGVSRGAQLHHFPTKAELLAAAVEHLLERRLHEFTEALETMTGGPELIDESVDLVWSMFQGPTFVAWIELWVAARTDPDLAATMAATDDRFTTESRELFIDVASDLGEGDPAALELFRDLTFAVMTGVAFQRMVPRGQRPAEDYLDVVKALGRSMVDQS
jgi:AcrR family transcriptional regulator